MQIPYRIEFTRPTRRDLRRAIGRRGVQIAIAALVIGSGTAATIGRTEWQQAQALRGTIAIISIPTGATVTIDGHAAGRSPEVSAVDPGDHTVTVGGPPLAQQRFSVRARSHATTRLSANLWRATPLVSALRPPLPGTQIDRVGYLGNGQVWLSVATLAAHTRQLWRLDRHALPVPFGPALSGPVAPNPAGTLLAHPATPPTGDAKHSPALIVAPVAAHQTSRRYALPLSADAVLSDLAWAPDGRHVLIVATRHVGDQAIDTLCWLDVGDGAVRILLELPSAVVAGSEVWRPDSSAVAFLARATGGATLCLLDTSSGRLRTLTDLSGNPPPLFAPLAWAPDGQAAVYAAAVPASRSGIGDLFGGPATATALFLLPGEDAPTRRLPVPGATNPAWQTNGNVLAVTTRVGHTPALQTFDLASGHVWPDGALAVPGSGALALHWDVTHAQALAARSDAFGVPSYWLLSFSSEVYP